MQKKRESRVKGSKIKRIVEILLEEKIFTEDELQNALRRQRSDRFAIAEVYHNEKTELSALS